MQGPSHSGLLTECAAGRQRESHPIMPPTCSVCSQPPHQAGPAALGPPSSSAPPAPASPLPPVALSARQRIMRPQFMKRCQSASSARSRAVGGSGSGRVARLAAAVPYTA
jgi:hypothetical protein